MKSKKIKRGDTVRLTAKSITGTAAGLKTGHQYTVTDVTMEGQYIRVKGVGVKKGRANKWVGTEYFSKVNPKYAKPVVTLKVGDKFVYTQELHDADWQGVGAAEWGKIGEMFEIYSIIPAIRNRLSARFRNGLFWFMPIDIVQKFAKPFVKPLLSSSQPDIISIPAIAIDPGTCSVIGLGKDNKPYIWNSEQQLWLTRGKK